MPTIICTSVGNDGFPSILNALRVEPAFFIIGCDSDINAPGVWLSDKGVVIPKREHEVLLLEAIIACKRDGDNILLPLSTEDQDFYSKHKSILNLNGINVLVSSHSSILIANNKHRLYDYCSKLGYPIPEYTIVNDSNSAIFAINQFLNVNKRCVIKLSRGTGAQCVKIVDPSYDNFSNFWDRNKLIISLSDVIGWLQGHELTEPLLISAYLPGDHLSVDAIITKKGVFHGVCRSETRHLYGLATHGVILDEPDVISLSRSIMSSIGLTGACNLEFRYGADGCPYLIEINPRFGGSIGHTVAAGANLPLALVYSELGIEYMISPANVGFSFARYWEIASCKKI